VARGLQSHTQVRGAPATQRPSASWRPVSLGACSLALLTLAASAFAQGAAGSASGQTPGPQTQQAPAQPAPLFPRHRRGLYKNGLGEWVLDATPQSPPLETDDPSVPEKGAYEINLTTSTDASTPATRVDLLSIDANYGIVPRILGHDLPTQLKLEVPISAARNGPDPYSTGIGQAQVGLKFNFYENEGVGVGMSFYPQLEFGIGAGAAASGLADRGETLVLPLLVSKDLKYVFLVVNAAANTPFPAPSRVPSATLSASVGVPVTAKVAVMAEIHGDSRVDVLHGRLLTVNVGLMRAVGQAAVLYANAGHTVWSGGEKHLYAGAGLKLLIKPGGRPR
jgi:hypothetical protein